jgi:hypothetical protein
MGTDRAQSRPPAKNAANIIQERAKIRKAAAVGREASRVKKENDAKAAKGSAKAKAQGKSVKGVIQRHSKAYLNAYSTSHNLLVPSVLSGGKSIPVNGVVKHHTTLHPGSSTYPNNALRSMTFVTNVGNSATTMVTVTFPDGQYLNYANTSMVDATTPNIYITMVAHSVATLSLAGWEGGPTAARAMKASLSISNNSNNYAVGGRTYFTNLTQRIKFPKAPVTMITDEWNAVFDVIRDATSTRDDDGLIYKRSTNTYTCHPIGEQEYVKFNEFRGNLTPSGFLEHIGVWAQSPDTATAMPEGTVATGTHTASGLGGVHEYRPMSTLVFLTEPATNAQEYTLTSRSTFVTRWPLETVLGQSMRDSATAESTKINQLRQDAERKSHTPQTGGGPSTGIPDKG